MNFQIGSQKQELKAWLTTSEHDFGVITTQCGSCATGNKFDIGSSSSVTDSDKVAFENMMLFNERSLQENSLSGRYVKD